MIHFRVMPLTLLLLALAVAVCAAPETSLFCPPLPTLPPTFTERLEAGEVVVLEEIPDMREETTTVDVVELILIDAPMEAVFDVADDCLAFPEFMVGVEGMELLDRRGSRDAVLASLWRYHAAASFIAITFEIITLSDRRSGVITWELNPEGDNDVVVNEGRWLLYPYGNSRTLVVYSARVQTAFPLPRWIEQYATESGTREVLLNLRYRVLTDGKWKKGDPIPGRSRP